MFEIVFNGMYSPTPPFNIELFLAFEVLTVLVETLTLWWFGGRWLRVYLEGEDTYHSFSFWDALLLSVTMNLVSALIAVPIWIFLRIGV